jgi:hypothetical protein
MLCDLALERAGFRVAPPVFPSDNYEDQAPAGEDEEVPPARRARGGWNTGQCWLKPRVKCKVITHGGRRPFAHGGRRPSCRSRPTSQTRSQRCTPPPSHRRSAPPAAQGVTADRRCLCAQVEEDEEDEEDMYVRKPAAGGAAQAGGAMDASLGRPIESQTDPNAWRIEARCLSPPSRAGRVPRRAQRPHPAAARADGAAGAG